jgi:hypothetical protein
MGTNVSFTTFEICTLLINLLTFALLLFLCVRTHTGDCRGSLLSKTKTSDGQSVIREAKLSMHESSHDADSKPFICT